MAKETKAPAKKAPAKNADAKRASTTEVLLVGAKVRAAIKASGCNTSSDAVDGLNACVHWLISQATARAAANRRKTVRAHDFIIG